MALTHYYRNADTGRFATSRARFCRCTVYIYDLLGVAYMIPVWFIDDVWGMWGPGEALAASRELELTCESISFPALL